MSTVLLIVIYIAFIGLGIPDSLFGTAWPAIYTDFGLPISAANYVTLLISGATVVSSFISARLINRFGTSVITAVSTSATAAALIGFAYSNSLIWFCVLSVPLGLGAGAIDAALNNYVALHYKASHMSFLHCFYGVGVSLSPYMMSLALSGEQGWRGGYKIVFFIQLVIALITILSLPLWKKVSEMRVVSETEKPRTVGFIQLFKMPAVRAAGFVFFGSCAIEFTCGVWGSTFLVNCRQMSVEAAARTITFYYIGMALGRFLSGVFAGRFTSWQIAVTGQAVTLVAIVILMLPLPAVAAGAGLFMIGVGNAPVFPNMIHLTPQNFGKDISQSAMGAQMSFAYMGIMLMPPLFGLMAQYISVGLFAYYLLTMFAVMAAAMMILMKRMRKN